MCTVLTYVSSPFLNGISALAVLAAVGDDPSSKMWILSITHADKHDSAMVERWKADMDGILVYVRF